MAGRDLHGVTCHQPSPEGLKVPWLEPALLASSATNRVNSGDRFPPGGKQWGAASLSPPVPRGSLRRTACSYDPLVTRRNNIYTHTYIYIYIHTIFYILFISGWYFHYKKGGHAYVMKLVFQHLLYQNWSWDPHFVVRIP